MDTRTGQIYDTREEAAAAGVPNDHLVTGPREALQELAGLVKRKNLAAGRRKLKAIAKATRERQSASRKRNRR